MIIVFSDPCLDAPVWLTLNRSPHGQITLLSLVFVMSVPLNWWKRDWI